MADLDTVSKRVSSVSLLRTMLAPPIPDGTLGAGDRQHMGWMYSGILSGALAALGYCADMNTRIMQYLRNQYSVTEGDLSTLIQRNLAGRTGEHTARFQALQDDATAAM